MMKNLIKNLTLMCLCMLVLSCSTSTKFTVRATPGTEILTTQKQRLAVADESGRAIFKISDDDYNAFLLSHAPNSNDYIPFALDYKYHDYIRNDLLEATGETIMSFGAGFGAAGGIAAICGSSELVAPFLLGGLGGVIVGACIYLPAHFRSEQPNHQYSYKFLTSQKVNNDIQFSYPIFDKAPIEVIPSSPVTTVKKILTSSEGISTSVKKLASSKSKKTIGDNASKIEGTYIGTGNLTRNNSKIEEYNNITVIIRKSSKDAVLVNVVESNGESFFESDMEYNVKKLSDEKFELTLNNVKTAKITIDAKCNLVYLHPRVNIEGDIYSLGINAKLIKE